MQVEREGPLIFMKVEVLALIPDYLDLDSPSSGKRVSNTWVIYLYVWDNSWKRLLIPNVLSGVKEPLKLRVEMSLRCIS